MHIITVSVLLCLCVVYNITVVRNSSWYFVLYLSGAYIIPLLRHVYICVCINIFVNVIPMVTAINLCTSYNLILGCTTSWASCHTYFLCIIGYSIFVILIDLNSQKWINTLLFELVFPCIKIHIFVPIFSIYHIFISIIKCFRCLLILGQLFT